MTVVSIDVGESLGNTNLGPQDLGYYITTRAKYRERFGSVGLSPGPDDERIKVAGADQIHLDLIGVTRWELLSSMLSKFPDLLSTFGGMWPGCAPVKFMLYQMKGSYVMLEAPNWPRGDLLDSGSTIPAAAISIVTCLYGGLHASAWNSFFPSDMERRVWKISAIVVAVSGCIASIFVLATDFKSLPDGGTGYGDGRIDSVPIAVVVGGHVLARLFLLFEAFFSLRKLPVDVFKTPGWTQLIPHI